MSPLRLGRSTQRTRPPRTAHWLTREEIGAVRRPSQQRQPAQPRPQPRVGALSNRGRATRRGGGSQGSQTARTHSSVNEPQQCERATAQQSDMTRRGPPHDALQRSKHPIERARAIRGGTYLGHVEQHKSRRVRGTRREQPPVRTPCQRVDPAGRQQEGKIGRGSCCNM